MKVLFLLSNYDSLFQVLNIHLSMQTTSFELVLKSFQDGQFFVQVKLSVYRIQQIVLTFDVRFNDHFTQFTPSLVCIHQSIFKILAFLFRIFI